MMTDITNSKIVIAIIINKTYILNTIDKVDTYGNSATIKLYQL